MADLNLVPNPTVIAVQAGIFFTSLFVVKKLFLDPYTRLRERRLNATVGGKDAALNILKQNETDRQTINAQIASAIDRSRQVLADAKQKATDERQRLVSAAERDAKETLETIHRQLKDELSGERAKVPSTVKDLSGALFAKLLA